MSTPPTDGSRSRTYSETHGREAATLVEEMRWVRRGYIQPDPNGPFRSTLTSAARPEAVQMDDLIGESGQDPDECSWCNRYCDCCARVSKEPREGLLNPEAAPAPGQEEMKAK